MDTSEVSAVWATDLKEFLYNGTITMKQQWMGW